MTFKTILGLTTLSLSNIDGKELFTIDNYKGEDFYKKLLKKGTYFMRIESGNKTLVKKITIK